MEILAKINWVDVLILIVMLRVSYIAFQDGLSHQILPLIGAGCVVVASLHYYTKIASYIYQNIVKIPIDILNLFSFILIGIVVGLILKLLKAVLDKIVKVKWSPAIEKSGGLIVGILKASVITSIVLIIIALVPLSYLQRSIRDKSLTGMYFLRIGPSIYGKFSKYLPTLKVEGAAGNTDNIVNGIVSEKSIAAKKSSVKKENSPEWEKPFK